MVRGDEMCRLQHEAKKTKLNIKV